MDSSTRPNSPDVIPPSTIKPPRGPLHELFRDARPPKSVSGNALKAKLRGVVALQVFVRYLASFDGGKRNEAACKDHTRHVGRLLYELQDPVALGRRLSV